MPEVREPLFNEQLHVMVPTGTLAAVRATAREEGQTTSEFVRAAIKTQLRRTDVEKRGDVRNVAHGPQISERNDRHAVCAVVRRRFPVGASPTRPPLQPEATGAVMEVTKWLKPSGTRPLPRPFAIYQTTQDFGT